MPSVPVESRAGFYRQDGMGIYAEVLPALPHICHTLRTAGAKPLKVSRKSLDYLPNHLFINVNKGRLEA